jgi:integrase
MDTKTIRLTDATVKRLAAPAKGNRIYYDSEVSGLGCRVTAAGHRAFTLTYYNRAGVQRRYTLGSFPDWSTTGAREEARRLKRLIDAGGDPLAEIAAERGAATVDDLIDRFLAEHVSRKRPNTQVGYRVAIENYIRPMLGRVKVSAVEWGDGDALHRKITKAGYATQANRVVAYGSKMFALAIKWRMRADNPFKGIERNGEQRRKRYASAAELKRLMDALDALADRQAADIFYLCLLTGCRVGEAMAARWDGIDLSAGKWSRPASATKQKAYHEVPLSAATKKLFAERRRHTNGPWVFPADSKPGHRVAVKKSWRAVCKTAGVSGLHIHDLRHSFAAQLVSSGASLPLVGSLLGHSNPSTTHRYAHLFDDPQRAAVERIGKLVTGSRR